MRLFADCAYPYRPRLCEGPPGNPLGRCHAVLSVAQEQRLSEPSRVNQFSQQCRSESSLPAPVASGSTTRGDFPSSICRRVLQCRADPRTLIITEELAALPVGVSSSGYSQAIVCPDVDFSSSDQQAGLGSETRSSVELPMRLRFLRYTQQTGDHSTENTNGTW